MKSEGSSVSRRQVAFGYGVVFLVLVYLNLWLRVDPRLIFHVQCPPFYYGGAFFAECIAQPGGPVAYSAAYLVQLFRIPWAGCLVITSAIGLVCAATGALMARLSGKTEDRLAGTIALVPGLLLAGAHGSYVYPLAHSLSLLAALLFAHLFMTAAPRKSAVGRLAVFLILAPVTYYACAGGIVVFLALCAAVELHIRKAEPRAVLWVFLYALCAGAIPWVYAVWVASVPVAKAYADLWPTNWGGGPSYIVIAAAGFVAFAAVAGAIWSARPRENAAARKDSEATALTHRGAAVTGKLEWTLQPLLLVLGAAAVFLAFDAREKVLVKLDYYAANEMWPDVLTYARENQSHPVVGMTDLTDRKRNFYVIHAINRALYRTSRLPYDLFSFPQLGGAPTLLLSDQTFCLTNREANLKRADLLFEMGRINDSEHMTHEAWSFYGDRPAIFKQLALINILKNRHEAARTYLTRLRMMPFESAWADRYLRVLEDERLLSADEELRWPRSAMFTTDYIGTTAFAQQEGKLIRLLQQNPRNRMAFEYLMAYYLLTDKPDRVAANAAGISTMGYSTMPRHYQEAILTHMMESGEHRINLYGLRIGDETLKRFQAFQEIVARYKADQEGLWNNLVGDFGNTFWFYHLFGVTGFGPETVPPPYDGVSGAS